MVTDAFTFDQCVAVDLVMGYRDTVSGAHQARRKLCKPVVEDTILQEMGRSRGGPRTTLAAFLQGCGSDGRMFLDETSYAVRMPAGVRERTLSMSWPWILLLGRWSASPIFGTYPPSEWLEEHAGQHHEQPLVKLSPSVLLDHMSNLRAWLPVLTGSVEEPEVLRMDVSLSLAWLQKLLVMMSPVEVRERLHLAPQQLQRWRKWRRLGARAAVAAHLTSQWLSNQKGLRRICKAALDIVMPELLTDAAMESLLDTVPSPSQMSKTTLYFDTAVILMAREQNNKLQRGGGCARYLLADSSPQAGRDWFLCKDLLLVVGQAKQKKTQQGQWKVSGGLVWLL